VWTELKHLVTGKHNKIQVPVKKSKCYDRMKSKVNLGNSFYSLCILISYSVSVVAKLIVISVSHSLHTPDTNVKLSL
jgi:hypothetical protein